MDKLKNLKLYKYLKRQHAESLLHDGEIKIGTLYDFRRQESVDMQRGDKNEGRMNYTYVVSEDTEFGDLPDIFKEQIVISGGGKLVLRKGCKATVPRDVSDNYIFCASKTLSRKLMNEFQADVCIEIFDVANFGQAIFNKLCEEEYIYPHSVSSECRYFGHEVDVKFDETAHFLKDEKFKHQDEYRFTYPPICRDKFGNTMESYLSKFDDGRTEFRVVHSENILPSGICPIILICPDLVKFCRIIDL